MRLLLDTQYVDAAEGIAGDNTFSILRDGTALDRHVGAESRESRAIPQAPKAETVVIGSGKGTLPIRGHSYRHDCVLMALESVKFRPALQVP
jgi:hypothetical protein